MSVHVTHPANLQGRDFVVGDLHGSLSLLERALRGVDFDPATDRLFSVGDLVDRGEDSFGCLKLLQEPWFFAVMGNHEEMMLDYYGFLDRFSDFVTESDGHPWSHNGAEWRYDLSSGAELLLQETLLPLATRLPFVRTIDLPDGGRFHIVHAELLAAGEDAGDMHIGWMNDTEVQKTEERLNDRSWVTGFDAHFDYRARLLWGRSLYHAMRQENVPRMEPGLSPVYCGHTIFPRFPQAKNIPYPVVARSHVFIDTGAYRTGEHTVDKYSHGLTLAEPAIGAVHFFGMDALDEERS